MKFCSNCGTKLDAHKVFCIGCGTQTNKPPTQQTNPTPVHNTATKVMTEKNMSFIIIAVVTAIVLIGIFILTNQNGSSGLVSTWENNQGNTIVFSRNGNGTVIGHHSIYGRQEASFNWEASGGTLVLRYVDIWGDSRNQRLVYEIVGSSLFITRPGGGRPECMIFTSRFRFSFDDTLARR